MIWTVLFLVAITASIFLIPKSRWKDLWPSGVIGIIVLYLIDSTLIKLGAFSFSNASPSLNGVPVFYLASAFFGAVLFINYLPRKRAWTFPYIILCAGILFVLEYFFLLTGHFSHYNWGVNRALILNIFGFTLVSWMAQWLESVRLRPSS